MPQPWSSLQKKTKPSSPPNPILLLSACLAGIESRYNGHHQLRRGLLKRLKGYGILPVCPEQLGGLSTPRSRAQIIGGDGRDVLRGKAKVINEHQQDVSASFVKGAKETLKIVRLNGIQTVYLKEGSPSCGTSRCIRGKRGSGPGVTAALLVQEGIEVIGIR